jgi:23S rRNA (uridine2552-2'-O)-methyltransferase
LKRGAKRTVASRAWLERQLNDPYVAEARKLGLRSRAAFKLIEIDDKYKIIKPGARIVDLGAAPGGWSIVAAERAKAAEGRGRVVAIDMHGMDPIKGVAILHKDFYDDDAVPQLIAALGGDKADAVLSDMAPHATGHRQTDHLQIMALAEAAYDFARDVLKPGGTFLAKVLRGGTEGELLKRLKQDFATVRHVKPQASRDDSAEMFVLATGYRG